jgi:hypothetical protein
MRQPPQLAGKPGGESPVRNALLHSIDLVSHVRPKSEEGSTNPKSTHQPSAGAGRLRRLILLSSAAMKIQKMWRRFLSRRAYSSENTESLPTHIRNGSSTHAVSPVQTSKEGWLSMYDSTQQNWLPRYVELWSGTAHSAGDCGKLIYRHCNSAEGGEVCGEIDLLECSVVRISASPKVRVYERLDPPPAPQGLCSLDNVCVSLAPWRWCCAASAGAGAGTGASAATKFG